MTTHPRPPHDSLDWSFDPPPRSAADRPALPPGAPATIGDWQLVELIGRGGDADVFLATHRAARNRVAIKLLRTDPSSPYDRRRHLDEARAITAIDHRNVVRLLEVGELDDRRVFFVMEHLEGTTLRAVLDSKGPLAPLVLLQISILIARGLGAAHARGIVHRDLKPSNVMVIPTTSGRFTIKLIDFGIAKFIDGKAGTIVGTPAYMSPEARRGEAIDHRTDLYSFGVLLHRALTGGYPDAARLAALGAQASRPPGPTAPLEAIIDRCLRSNPVDRFPTASHLLQELELARALLSPPSSPRGRAAPDAKTQALQLLDDVAFSVPPPFGSPAVGVPAVAGPTVALATPGTGPRPGRRTRADSEGSTSIRQLTPVPDPPSVLPPALQPTIAADRGATTPPRHVRPTALQATLAADDLSGLLLVPARAPSVGHALGTASSPRPVLNPAEMAQLPYDTTVEHRQLAEAFARRHTGRGDLARRGRALARQVMTRLALARERLAPLAARARRALGAAAERINRHRHARLIATIVIGLFLGAVIGLVARCGGHKATPGVGWNRPEVGAPPALNALEAPWRQSCT